MLFWLFLVLLIVVIVIILFVYNNKPVKKHSEQKTSDIKIEHYVRLLTVSAIAENDRVNNAVYHNLTSQLKTDNQKYMIDLLADYINLRRNLENDARAIILERAKQLDKDEQEFIYEQLKHIDTLFESPPAGTETFIKTAENNLATVTSLRLLEV